MSLLERVQKGPLESQSLKDSSHICYGWIVEVNEIKTEKGFHSLSASHDNILISVFSCPGSSIPDLGQWLSATFEFCHKE